MTESRMIVSEINELRKLLVDFKAGDVSREDLSWRSRARTGP